MTGALYLTRTGLLEPLGQSQVMAYLRGLSADYEITLVSFEKPSDLEDTAAVAAARADCAAHGIRWVPLRFRRGPKLLAPLFGMAQMLWIARREVRAGRAHLIHARSYVPAGVALLAHWITGVPFIFDMRALWPEELITAGRLRRGGLVHRALKRLERACLSHAAATVSLTRAAVPHLCALSPGLDPARVHVIPTCADLDRFVPTPRPAGDPPVFGCAGTVLSGWFRADLLDQIFGALARRDPAARFEVLTRDDPEAVRAALPSLAGEPDRLTVFARRPEDMPEALGRHAASVIVYAGGAVSELGRSPTRLAELLGCGVPVIANAGVGDVAEVIERHRVGVVLRGEGRDEIAAAVDALRAGLTEPELPARCRAAAEAEFSLAAGTAAYAAIYERVLGRSEAPADTGIAAQ